LAGEIGVVHIESDCNRIVAKISIRAERTGAEQPDHASITTIRSNAGARRSWARTPSRCVAS
jgi:hypothetical protein